MSTPRYLVTGGAGFIGSNLVAALTAAGERVRVLDNLATGRWENLDGLPHQSSIERITGDIRDAAAVAAAAKGVEVILHQAALGSVPRSVETPVESNAVNVGGTVTVLDVARRQGVRRVIFAASSSAYGETPVLPKHEAMEPMPLSPYAVTKLACEHYMKVFAGIYGIETLSLRYFNVFGPNQTPDGAYAAAIPRFIDAALQNRSIPIYGDGEQTRDFCFIENTVLANLLGATSPKKFKGEIINIAGGRRIGLNELCREISRVLGRDVAIEHLPPRAGDIRHSLADISRAAELIGYEPRVRWEDGIAPTVTYLRTLREKGPAAASATVTCGKVPLPKAQAATDTGHQAS
ncbi:Vi polysaccharide biosynthesis protein VipB/TviC [Sorangium cellulosum]|uniref:Vi polysaccharide biosynthesis protein VipB/TviC n=2 Tax=Sorangium cellulosum TaxID=56 RepID=A0A150PVU0_SORCE|nr:SDR family oxidoreductase [Sorangium cellulosum]AGP37042.1 Vi polysaccharide biosynthesis protein vipB/tviC [Sorangium cellulosum So0157-2]KYF59855.1 Vi polysaccharide biosynthesis protein VipB/TviC [Sorangium cellulosum]KYG04313.1 Vi polysaccharide biosynthesis protein VipB/TviC [Sorangium cellulosum]